MYEYAWGSGFVSLLGRGDSDASLAETLAMDSGSDEEEENDFTVEQIQQMFESDDDVLQGEVGEEELT